MTTAPSICGYAPASPPPSCAANIAPAINCPRYALRVAERERFLKGMWPRVKDHIVLLGLNADELLDRQPA